LGSSNELANLDADASTAKSMTLDEVLKALVELFSNLTTSRLRKLKSAPANGRRHAPPDIEVYNQETLLGVIREVFACGTQLDAEVAIRAIARSSAMRARAPAFTNG
jgi:hypothetical protein